MLLKLLTLPVSAPMNGSLWLAKKITEQVEQEYYNPDLVQAKLMQLELQLDLEQITEDEYMEQEEILLARLKEIAAWQKQQMGS